MMPLMDGLTAIRVLQHINSQVKIIGFSGMTTHHDLTVGTDIKAFLKKPFSADHLLQTLAEVLRAED
jgi:two-component system, cell cycle sensor histidine kinase and response regulator CckA